MANEQLGVEAVLEGLGQFLSGVDRMTDAIEKFGNEAHQSEQKSNGLSAGTVALGTALGGLAVAAGEAALSLVSKGFDSFAKFLGDSVSAAQESEDAIAQLNQTLKSTGGVAGVTSKQAQDLASGLQAVTKFGDEAILGGESLLLTFTNIGENVFPQATETMLDMSQALKQDLKSSAVQLGKALQDPITGITALRRVGVNFTDEQQKLIKSLVETGRLEEAQTLILKELQTEFGGSARAAGQTFGGQLEILKNRFNDIQETVGNALIPVLSVLATKAAEVGGKIADFFARDDVVAGIQNISNALSALVGLFLEGDPEKRIDMFNQLSDAIGNPALAEGIALISSGLIGLFGILTGSDDGVSRFENAMSGLAALIEANTPAITDALNALGEVLGQWIIDATPVVLGKLAEWGLALVIWMGTKGKSLLDQAVGKLALSLWEWIVDATPTVLEKLGELIGSAIDWLTGPSVHDMFLSAGNTMLSAMVKGLLDRVGEFEQLFAPIQNVITGIAGRLASWFVDNFLAGIKKLLPGGGGGGNTTNTNNQGGNNTGDGGGGGGDGGGASASASARTTQPLSAQTAVRTNTFTPSSVAGGSPSIVVGPNYVRSNEDIHSVAYNVRRYSPAPAR